MVRYNISINDEKRVDISLLNKTISQMKGEIEYIPPKFSAKKIDGKRAYDLARQGLEVELKKSKMNIYDIKLLKYNHPFITFEAIVSEGSYIRSLAQLILEKLHLKGTLSYLERLNEGKFFFENEKDLNPINYLDIPYNNYTGTKEWLQDGKKISIDFLENKNEGKYILKFYEFFSIIEIVDGEVKYILNKVLLND